MSGTTERLWAEYEAFTTRDLSEARMAYQSAPASATKYERAFLDPRTESVRTMVRRYVGQNERMWKVYEWAPSKQLTIDKKDWPRMHTFAAGAKDGIHPP